MFKFKDHQLVDFLDFGFPTGFLGLDIPTLHVPNHSSALGQPAAVNEYIQAEVGFQALAGPFHSAPFDWCRVNPMMTRPKRDSHKLRVVLDLSFPDMLSVNSQIPRGSLDDAPFKVRLPTPTDFAAIISDLGPNCALYKIDLSRAYRQLRSDPLDWPLLGITWGGEWFVDVAIPFGLRHGASACQRVTETVIEMVQYDVQARARAYIDNTIGAALPHLADLHYNKFIDTMAVLGLDSAPHKCQPPTTCLTWIGVTYDTVAMTMAIDASRIREAIDVCRAFLCSVSVSRKFMEWFIGKIYHAIKCTDSARRFTSRLLALMARTSYGQQTIIDQEAFADAHWLACFLPQYNGTNIIKPTIAQLVIEVDACPTGAGGYIAGVEHYRFQCPPSITSLSLCIASLECFNILISIRLWITRCRGLVVLLFSDNAASVCAINSGRAHDPLLQAILRELWMLCTVNDVTLVARHKPGVELVIPDALSRVVHPDTCTPAFQHILTNLTEPQCFVTWELLLPPCYI